MHKVYVPMVVTITPLLPLLHLWAKDETFCSNYLLSYFEMVEASPGPWIFLVEGDQQL